MTFFERRKRLLADIVRNVESFGVRVVSSRFDKQALGSLYVEVEGGVALGWDARDHIANIVNVRPESPEGHLWTSPATWDSHLLASHLVECARRVMKGKEER
jgi:hypothetical protein